MNNSRSYPRIITRRDSLKVALLPAAALGTRWLIGCAGDHTDASAGELSSTAQAGATLSGSGGSALGQASPGRAIAGSVSVAGAPARSSPAAASGGMPAALSSTAGSSAAAPAATSGGASGQLSTAAAGVGAPAAGSGVSAAGAAGRAGAGGANTAAANVMWATGGTKAMQGNYPDPFSAASMGKACMLYPTQTIGPCYAQGPMMREDISDGLAGLPVRLSLLVVGKDGCTPIPNASVDIWHSGSQGIYSAYATGTTCNPGMDDVKSKMFCRGIQSTNESGRVSFSTVFPGWYRGRTIHVHFTVRLNGRESVTSQLYFEDALVDEILGQGDYKARGKRDTTNTKDGIFKSGGATPEMVLLSTAKRADGVLHAWKVLAIG